MGHTDTSKDKSSHSEETPSMEEILLSIRNVIAGIAENRQDVTKASIASAFPKPVSEPAPPVHSDDDVLELTEVADHNGTPLHKLSAVVEAFEAGTISSQAKKNASRPVENKDLSVLQQIDKAIENIGIPPSKSTTMPSDASLLNNETVNKTANTLQGLVKKLRKNTISPSEITSRTTVEDLVTETLRPYLTEWINQHLPTIVERIVEREVKQIVEKYVAEEV